MALSITDALFDKYNEACDWFINNDNVGRQCTIVYPPKRTPCSNCLSPVGSSSNNSYRHGGPAPFSFGNCPVCGGSGYSEVESTATIRLRVYWNRKDWAKIVGSQGLVGFADSDVMAIGFMSDLPNVLKAIEIIIVNQQREIAMRCTISGRPQPHGFGKDRYFMAFFKAA